MRGAYIVIAVAFAVAHAYAQDVKMESNTSEEELLRIENTGIDGKKGIKVISNGEASMGLDIQAGDGGIQMVVEGTGYSTFGISSMVTGSGDYTYNIGHDVNVSSGEGSANYGVSAYVHGTDAYNVAVYGHAANGEDNYAGYFDGEIVVTSCSGCTTSDQKLKKNVRDLDNGLAKVMVLKPRAYEMRAEEFKGSITLAKEPQFGLIAQEVQPVLPHLVKEVRAPVRLTEQERKNKVRKEPLRYMTLNYTGLIPVMLKAIQEQQALIEALQAEVAALKR